MILLIAGQSNAADLAKRLHKLIPDVQVRDCVKHGYALIKKCAMPDAPEDYWLHIRCLEHLAQRGPARVLWWIQGENEALNGCTQAEYTEGLYSLNSAMYDAWGPFKMVISPIGAMSPRYKFARAVLAAQYRWNALTYIGPEYYDLLDTQSDGIHMGNEGKDEFVRRMVRYLHDFRLLDTLATVDHWRTCVA